jgi:dTDP-4-dehydrorhamnose reductase
LFEQEVCDVNPNTLLVRTNVFGFSPFQAAPGLVETILNSLQEGQPLALDCMRHATPILATDFADVLERAYQLKLRGLHHLAGGERINPFRFACLLADQFGLSMSNLSAIETPFENRREFGAGESSLHRTSRPLKRRSRIAGNSERANRRCRPGGSARRSTCRCRSCAKAWAGCTSST